MYSVYYIAECGVVRKIKDYKVLENAQQAFCAACKDPQKFAGKHSDIVKITLNKVYNDTCLRELRVWHY